MSNTAVPGSLPLPMEMTLPAIRERDRAYTANEMQWDITLQPIKDRRELLDRLDAAINVLKHYAEQDIGGAARSILPRLTR